jgi:hypothetical protein
MIPSDPVLLLLFLGIWVSVGIMIACAIAFKDDGQIFQVLSSLVAGFSGAFFGRMKPQEKPPDPGSTTVTSTSQVTDTSPQKPVQ